MKLGFREVLFVVAMMGLLAASYFLVFTRKNSERLDLVADTAQKQRELGQLQQATAGIEDLSRKIDELQKAIEFFESKLPQEREIADILDQVTKLADSNALQARSFKTLKTERNASYSEQPIQLSLSGDFNGFYQFLLQLEKLPRITRVTTMNLQKIAGNDGDMEAQITLSIFFEPETGARTVASAR